MAKKIIAINSGSSSLKFQIYDMPEEKLIIKGMFERIGLASKMLFSYEYVNGKKINKEIFGCTHEQAIHFLVDFLRESSIIEEISNIMAVGHRIAHGGEKFHQATLINEDCLKEIEKLSILAPLHNPVNIKAIQIFNEIMPNCPQIAVFDTSFHHTIPEQNYIYPIPYKYYREDNIRRYGFHGTSHQYVANEAAKYLEGNISDLKLITCHLGNGSSICGISEGTSKITSMGFTPTAGIMMGTRCGDIDPAIITYLQKRKDLTYEEIENILNRQSGFLGISEKSNDLRDLTFLAEEGDEQAVLALRVFVSQIKRTIGSYMAELGGLDAVIFTAGIGENSSLIRQLCCEGLDFLGIQLDVEKNNMHQTIISHKSKITVMVIPTDEEVMIARESYALIKND